MFTQYFSLEDREKMVQCFTVVSLLLPVICSFYFFCDIPLVASYQSSIMEYIALL